MTTKDLATAYAAARVAFHYVLYVAQKTTDGDRGDALDKAAKELLAIEQILQKYMEEPNENHDISDKGNS